MTATFDIIQTVCDVFKVTRYELMSKCRYKHVVDARVTATSLLIELTGATYREVCAMFSRCHSWIFTAMQRYADALVTDKFFSQKVAAVRLQLNAA